MSDGRVQKKKLLCKLWLLCQLGELCEFYV